MSELNKTLPSTSKTTNKRLNSEISPEPSIIPASKRTLPIDGWRTFPVARKKPAPLPKVTLKDYWLADKNKFHVLDTAPQPSEKTAPEQSAVQAPHPKPPPIFIHQVGDIKPVQNELKDLIGDNFVLTTMNGQQLKILLPTKEEYKKVTTMLTDKNTEFHSFQIKEEKAFRVVLRGIRPSTENDDIKTEIEELGYTVKNISVIRNARTKEAMPLFNIDFKQQQNNKSIYNVKRLLHSVVTFEPPKPKREIVQCTRCQRFGHTKSYCHLTPRCVKCISIHATGDCPRPKRGAPNKDSNVQCINCGENHPANYK